jgi:hypothetical protein
MESHFYNPLPCCNSIVIFFTLHRCQMMKTWYQSNNNAYKFMKYMRLTWKYRFCTSILLNIIIIIILNITIIIVGGLEVVVCYFALASHLFWGTWAVIQSQISSIDFDFAGYAKLRYEGYFYHKKEFSFLTANSKKWSYTHWAYVYTVHTI